MITFWTVQFGMHWGGDASMNTLGKVFNEFSRAEDFFTGLVEAPDDKTNFVWLTRVKADPKVIHEANSIELASDFVEVAKGIIVDQTVLACRELMPPGLPARIKSFVQSALDSGGLNLDGQTEAEKILEDLK